MSTSTQRRPSARPSPPTCRQSSRAQASLPLESPKVRSGSGGASVRVRQVLSHWATLGGKRATGYSNIDDPPPLFRNILPPSPHSSDDASDVDDAKDPRLPPTPVPPSTYKKQQKRNIIIKNGHYFVPMTPLNLFLSLASLSWLFFAVAFLALNSVSDSSTDSNSYSSPLHAQAHRLSSSPAPALFSPSSTLPHTRDSDPTTLYAAYTEFYSKNHAPADLPMRYSNFLATLSRLETLNDMHGPCGVTGRPVFGLNNYSDFSEDEFEASMLSASPSSPPTSIASVTSTSSSSRTPTTGSCAWYNPFCYFTTSSSTAVPLMVTPPNSVNYTPLLPSTIQTQGSCGGCWAISASLASTAALYIKYRTMPSVCATDVIACAPNSYGCDGGWPSDAYSYLATLGSSVWRSEGCDEDYDGLEDALDGYGRGEVCAVLQYEEGYVMDTTEEEEPRGGVLGYAYATPPCKCYANGVGCNCAKQDEWLALLNVASYGPASACIDATELRNYAGGVLPSSACSSKFEAMNHCLLVVGFVLDGDVPYWILRNQWGEGWGHDGHVYVAFGNSCGVLNDLTFAVV